MPALKKLCYLLLEAPPNIYIYTSICIHIHIYSSWAPFPFWGQGGRLGKRGEPNPGGVRREEPVFQPAYMGVFQNSGAPKMDFK